MKIDSNFSFMYVFKTMPRHEHISDAFCTVDFCD